jgi:hypothetical protein
VRLAKDTRRIFSLDFLARRTYPDARAVGSSCALSQSALPEADADPALRAVS